MNDNLDKTIDKWAARLGARIALGALTLLLVTTLPGCSTIRSGAHHNETHSFDGYRTFSWIANDPLIVGNGEQQTISPLTQKKIAQKIQGALKTKCFRFLADRENPSPAIEKAVAATIKRFSPAG